MLGSAEVDVVSAATQPAEWNQIIAERDRLYANLDRLGEELGRRIDAFIAAIDTRKTMVGSTLVAAGPGCRQSGRHQSRATPSGTIGGAVPLVMTLGPLLT